MTRTATVTVDDLAARPRETARAWAPTDGITDDAAWLAVTGASRHRELVEGLSDDRPTWTDAESGRPVALPADVPEDERVAAFIAHDELRAKVARASRTCAGMSDEERIETARRKSLATVARHRPAGMLAPVMLDIADHAAADAIADWYAAAADAVGGDLARLSALADLPDGDLPPSVAYFAVAHARRMLRSGAHGDVGDVLMWTTTHSAAPAPTGEDVPDGPVILGPSDTESDVESDVESETVAALKAATGRGTPRKARGQGAGGGRRDDGARSSFAARLLASRMTEAERAREWAVEFGVRPASWRVQLARMRKAGTLAAARPVKGRETTVRPSPRGRVAMVGRAIATADDAALWRSGRVPFVVHRIG